MLPTVGRITHFTPHIDSAHYSDAPLAAVITKVHSEDCVNLAVLLANGSLMPDAPDHVQLFSSDSEALPAGGCFCQWPPMPQINTLPDDVYTIPDDI